MGKKISTEQMENNLGICRSMDNRLLFPDRVDITINDFEKRSLLKTLWEKKKMLVTSIFSFIRNVFNPFLNKFLFLVTFILLSANASNLDHSLPSFGKELKEKGKSDTGTDKKKLSTAG